MAPGEAAALQPLPLRSLINCLLMDLKHSYLLSGMNEEALGIVRWVQTDFNTQTQGGVLMWISGCVDLCVRIRRPR